MPGRARWMPRISERSLRRALDERGASRHRSLRLRCAIRYPLRTCNRHRLLPSFGQLLAGPASVTEMVKMGRIAEELSGVVPDATRASTCPRSAMAPASAPHRLSLIAGVGMLTLLAACGQENRFIAPPPPKVTVQLPLQQTVTPYLEATGNAASVNTVKLLARVQGYVQEIKYQDGATVKKGTPLFVIEPEPYKVQLEQAQAAEEGAKATLINAEAEFTRQQEL